MKDTFIEITEDDQDKPDDNAEAAQADDKSGKNGGNDIKTAAGRTAKSDEKNKSDGNGDKNNADRDIGKNSGKKAGKKNSVLQEIISWVGVFVIAAAAAFFINTFLIANSTVPTGSMESTIMQNDRVIGSRLSYRFSEPERGDIVIFKFGWICRSCKTAQGEGKAPDICPNCGKEIKNPEPLYYLKRLIGLPGDTVEIRAEGTVSQSEIGTEAGLNESMGDDAKLMTAAVYVNGEKLEETYLKEPMLYSGDMVFEVPEGSYFFMGDNRNNSLDARFWEDPYIEREQIIAKVLFRYFPKPSLVK